MLPVVALSSPPLPWILIGNSRSNRFPVLASSDIHCSSKIAPTRERAIFKRWKKSMNQVYTMKPSSRVDGVPLKQQESLVLRGQKEWLPAQSKQPAGGPKAVKAASRR